MLGQLPGLCGITLIPLYLVVWLIYIRKLFQGINNALQNLKIPIDEAIMRKCKLQYTVLCDLIEDFNQNYGIFTMHCIYVTTFMIFALRYSIIISLVSVSRLQLHILIIFLFILTESIILIYHCASLKSEISAVMFFVDMTLILDF